MSRLYSWVRVHVLSLDVKRRAKGISFPPDFDFHTALGSVWKKKKAPATYALASNKKTIITQRTCTPPDGISEGKKTLRCTHWHQQGKQKTHLYRQTYFPEQKKAPAAYALANNKTFVYIKNASYEQKSTCSNTPGISKTTTTTTTTRL